MAIFLTIKVQLVIIYWWFLHSVTQNMNICNILPINNSPSKKRMTKIEPSELIIGFLQIWSKNILNNESNEFCLIKRKWNILRMLFPDYLLLKFFLFIINFEKALFFQSMEFNNYLLIFSFSQWSTNLSNFSLMELLRDF